MSIDASILHRRHDRIVLCSGSVCRSSERGLSESIGVLAGAGSYLPRVEQLAGSTV